MSTDFISTTVYKLAQNRVPLDVVHIVLNYTEDITTQLTKKIFVIDENFLKKNPTKFDLINKNRLHSGKPFDHTSNGYEQVPCKKFLLFTKRCNQTYRVSKFVRDYPMPQSYIDKKEMMLCVYDMKPHVSILCNSFDSNKILLFFKMYDHKSKKVVYLGSRFIKSKGFLPKISTLCNLLISDDYHYVEEFKNDILYYEKKLNNLTVEQNELTTGDILWIVPNNRKIPFDVKVEYRYEIIRQ